jgi:hypothetical protein
MSAEHNVAASTLQHRSWKSSRVDSAFCFRLMHPTCPFICRDSGRYTAKARGLSPGGASSIFVWSHQTETTASEPQPKPRERKDTNSPVAPHRRLAGFLGQSAYPLIAGDQLTGRQHRSAPTSVRSSPAKSIPCIRHWPPPRHPAAPRA